MPDTITTAEAAVILGKSVATVNRLALLGRLTPTLKLPGKTGAYLFARADVEALKTTSGGVNAAFDLPRQSTVPAAVAAPPLGS